MLGHAAWARLAVPPIAAWRQRLHRAFPVPDLARSLIWTGGSCSCRWLAVKPDDYKECSCMIKE